jgi:exodeoxyribonuclease VII large subunit
MSNMMSVSSLNTKIKSLLEATFMHTMVEGEVASATYHSSGHLYFSIKDKDSSVKCVMWRSSVSKMKFRIEKGMHIVVEGSVSVYTPRGEYQFQTVRIEPFGQGALALAYEQLKEKLKEKGYFEAERKKPIPKYIHKIALVTAKDSAALHDMLKIIEKRWALVEVSIVDTLVQGEQAGQQIARSLQYADTLGVDVVVVGRGGGSAEDLWPFNEEVVANAIFNMQTAVVSAVGHEVDVLISDFVADLRAPTPSAAMEMILPDSAEILYTLNETQERFSYMVGQSLQRSMRDLKHSEEMLLRASPLRLLGDVNQAFIRLKDEYKRTIEYRLERFLNKIPELKKSYTQNIVLNLQKKKQELELDSQKFFIVNPKLQCKIGWAQVSVLDKSVALSHLKIEDTFLLQDAQTRIEAICIKRETL